jgi:hypothetical protein
MFLTFSIVDPEDMATHNQLANQSIPQVLANHQQTMDKHFQAQPN